MLYEENENLETGESIVLLSEEELQQVAGGKERYIEGDSGKSNVRTGPGLEYKSIGTLHRGESARYLGKTATDDRGVLWYMIRWDGHDAWVSSMYTKKVKY